MRAILILAEKEIRDGLRNRWVLGTILSFAGLALSLAFLGSVPVGTTRAGELTVAVAGLSSLTVYLMPLIALMLSYDALVGEFERGTMLLLLSYPVTRRQVVLGKFLGHLVILAVAVTVGYGGAGLFLVWSAGGELGGLGAYLAMMASSVLLGGVFLALGYLVSVLVRERSAAAGWALGLWLFAVVLYDLALLAVVVAGGDALEAGGFLALLLASPTDAYRVLNLIGDEAVAAVAGLAGAAAEAGIEASVPVLAMAAWLVLPLAVTLLLFQRRDL